MSFLIVASSGIYISLHMDSTMYCLTIRKSLSYLRDRLVLPIPLFLALYFLVIICILQKVIKIEDPILYATFWSFVVVGYVIYDVCHYALHHIDTTKSKDTWFHRLQVYHNRHHFSGEEAGFGVSSPLWDYILRTTYKQKKISWFLYFSGWPLPKPFKLFLLYKFSFLMPSKHFNSNG